jgi:hypothetical protein
MTKVIEIYIIAPLQNNFLHTNISFAYDLSVRWGYYVEQVW